MELGFDYQDDENLIMKIQKYLYKFAFRARFF